MWKGREEQDLMHFIELEGRGTERDVGEDKNMCYLLAVCWSSYHKLMQWADHSLPWMSSFILMAEETEKEVTTSFSGNPKGQERQCWSWRRFEEGCWYGTTWNWYCLCWCNPSLFTVHCEVLNISVRCDKDCMHLSSLNSNLGKNIMQNNVNAYVCICCTIFCMRIQQIKNVTEKERTASSLSFLLHLLPWKFS